MENRTYSCPICQQLLETHQDGESLWCPNDCEKFNLAKMERLATWRSMSLESRADEVRRRGRDVIADYGIQDEDYADIEDFIVRRKSSVVFEADVAPDKEALLSLARG